MEAVRALREELTDIKIDVARVETGLSAVADRMDRLEDGLGAITKNVAELTAALALIVRIAKPALILASMLGVKALGSDIPWERIIAMFQ